MSSVPSDVATASYVAADDMEVVGISMKFKVVCLRYFHSNPDTAGRMLSNSLELRYSQKESSPAGDGLKEHDWRGQD